MKSTLKAFGSVALVAMLASAVAFANDTVSTSTTASTTTADGGDTKEVKDLKKQLSDAGINYVETAQKGITLSGYVDTSYTYQFASLGENGGASSESNLRSYDHYNNSFNVNAVKIALEKALSDKNELSAGFRIDTIYGSDAKYLGDSAFNTASGTAGSNALTAQNTSGLAIEQAFVKAKIPVGNGIEVDFGKQVSYLGYEVIESPANLNFSRGLLFTNLVPATQTGITAAYNFNDTFSAKFGIIDGWNNSQTTNPANASNNFTEALTGQFTINAPGKNANITQSFIYSPNGDAQVSPNGGAGIVVYDIWGNWNPTFVKDSALTLGFNIDYDYNGSAGAVGAPTASQDSYGVALYSKYQFTKVFSLAGRGEYLHDNGDESALIPVVGLPHADNDNYEFTLTAGFNIWDNLLTRVEYRHDVGASGAGVGSQDQIALNAVYSF